MAQEDQVAVIMAPTPAQGHINQLVQLSCLICSYRNDIPVYFVGIAVHNRQAKLRVNGLNPQDLAKIHFHDLPTPPQPSADKLLSPMQLLCDATLSLREPFASFLRKMSGKFRRVVVIHDMLTAVVVQDVASIPNAESYAFTVGSAIAFISYLWEEAGKPFPVPHPNELPPMEGCVPADAVDFIALQKEPLNYTAGYIFNTCRLIEGRYLEVLDSEENSGNRKSWAMGPFLPSVLSVNNDHKCLQWLHKQEPNSVIYVSFGTTTSLSDEQIKELALGLEQSRVKFIWVLRDADKVDDVDGEVRRAELPEGFEERVRDVGMVVRDWAPQPQILAHKSTGGFMSHCGWNSCLETMTNGVPVAAWPMFTDQPRNTVLMTDILRMGVVVREWKRRTEVVEAARIEGVLKRLMVSEEGDEMRRRAEEVRDTVRQAMEDGGASRLEFEGFIAHIAR